jgi:hypothetical protein
MPNIIRGGGGGGKKVAKPTINLVSLVEPNVTFTIKNNENDNTLIYYGLNNVSDSSSTINLTANATSSNLSFSGLLYSTEYSIKSFAKSYNKMPSLVDTLTFTTGEPTELYAFSSQIFTNAGVTGRTGPTLSQCTTAYSGQSWVNNTSFFNVVDGIQYWTVPDDGSYRIEVAGASGGNGLRSGRGGYGALITGTFNLIKGEIIRILVGQQGSNAPDISSYHQPTGGGGSFVVRSPYNTLASATIVAGGGGGGGVGNTVSNQSASDASLTTSGKTGAGTASGAIGTGGTNGSGGGDGSDRAGGGAGFTGIGGHANTTRAQAFTSGGTGGQNTANTAVQGGFGGGGGGASSTGWGSGSGGGGYSGGGGIYSSAEASEGFGGGGGSYNGGTNQLSSIRTSAGHGYVTITKL